MVWRWAHSLCKSNSFGNHASEANSLIRFSTADGAVPGKAEAQLYSRGCKLLRGRIRRLLQVKQFRGDGLVIEVELYNLLQRIMDLKGCEDL